MLGAAFYNPTWIEKDHLIRLQDGSRIKIRSYTPIRLRQNSAPVMVLIHGGGSIMGDLDTASFTCRLFVVKLGLVVFTVDYRLCPEVQAEVPALDVFCAVEWVAANAHICGGDLSQGFVIGGSSSGGCLAVIALIRTKEESLGNRISGCFLSCPIFFTLSEDERDEIVFTFEHDVSNLMTHGSLVGDDRSRIRTLFSSDRPYWKELTCMQA